MPNLCCSLVQAMAGKYITKRKFNFELFSLLFERKKNNNNNNGRNVSKKFHWINMKLGTIDSVRLNQFSMENELLHQSENYQGTKQVI